MRPKELDCLFEPIIIGTMELKNRLVMAPMGTSYGDDGFVTDRLTDYLSARARGGAGLITVEVAYVHRLGKVGLSGELSITDDKYIPGLKSLSDAIHRAGAKTVIQLNHAGRYARSKNLGEQPVAPSAIPSRYTGEKPRELSTEEVEEIVEAFAEGAGRARDAGFDGVELMGSSGYLISQFLSPVTNKRTDKYGGDGPAERANFVKEIIEKIREKMGYDFNLCVKMSVEDYLPGGITIEDSQVMGRIFIESGADRLHAWAGWHESNKPMLPMSVPRAAFAHLALALKEITDTPVTTVGRINDPFVAARLLREGKADLIALGRGLLADPEFGIKAQEGRVDEIRTCIACCACFDTIMFQMHKSGPEGLICAINPELGREVENLLRPVDKGKRVLIIGGGPGGMEAARVAAIKGHTVSLWEKSDRLGGMLRVADIPPLKEEIGCLTAYLSRQMEINNVRVELNRDATREEILRENPDCVIVACGAKQNVPEIPGIADGNVVMALDLLTGKIEAGQDVVLIGGGLIGVDIAEYLDEKKKKVTLLTRQAHIGADIGISTRWVTMMRIKERQGIKVMTKTTYKEIKKEGVVIERDGEEMFIPADTVVISGGLMPDRDLIETLKGEIPVQEIGDCIEPRKIKDAIHEGFQAALKIQEAFLEQQFFQNRGISEKITTGI